MRKVSIVRRISFSEINQDIYVVRHPVLIEEVRARCVYLSFGGDVVVYPDVLESILYVNDFLQIPIDPYDVLEGIPQLRWEVLPLREWNHLKVRWSVDTSGSSGWSLVNGATLEVWMIGRIPHVERTDPPD